MATSMFKSSFDLPAASAATTPPPPLSPSDRPLVLLPVRLETRFFTLAGGVTELRVRIYPDRVHVDSHEPELTPDERTWAQHYWNQDWTAGNNRGARADAWRQLADRFGAARAAWIARVSTPTNPRPTSAPPAGQPPVAPVFPNIPVAADGQTSSWRQAPQARLLPDRWIAVVHSAGAVALTVTGRNIRKPLAVGPDPRAPQPDAQTEAAIERGDVLPIDSGMKWMIDFDEAEAAGMALRITVPAATLTAGLDSLVVFGVAPSLTTAESATQLADLLDAHHYTEGLEFLRYGTPTNNTDDKRAGYDSDDPGHERSFDVEVANNQMLGVNNAIRVGTALGLPFARIAPTLGKLSRAGDNDDRDMRSMNTALWQVGWGYYLSNMMGAETGLTTASVDWAREYFSNYVRSAGPFPTLRCGPQPYGILPVTSLDLWSPGPAGESVAQETWLKSLLLNLRDRVWRPMTCQAPRIGMRQSPPAPDADLVDVMRTDGVSSGYFARAVLGRHYVEHLFSVTAQGFADYRAIQDSTAARMLALAGLPAATQAPHLARAFFATGASSLTAPLVQPGEVSLWRKLEPNYITALLSAPSINSIIAARPNPAATDHATSLLQTLLRHAMLREIASAAARITSTVPGNNLAALLRDAELVDLVTGAAPTQHWRRQLDRSVPSITGTGTIRQFLEGLTTFTSPSVAPLGEFRASLQHLQGLDSQALQLLMQGTLDLSAHRLDAWITSFATKRLAMMSVDGPMGQYVGGYGWVENLRPAPAGSTVPVSALPAGEQGPLVAPANDTGFIHAPSMTHATTAALLRNSHLGAANVAQPNGPFAIDLSSRRVREATRLLDGVRQGQPLGALLGYRVERHLHELTLDRFIAPLRRAAPLTARDRGAEPAPVEAIAANNVVDGLVLHRRWTEENPAVLAELQKAVPAPTTAELQTVTREMAALADAIDGLSDALTAETAYQMARGNTARVSSTVTAIAQGDAPPPELEVARMPRSGTPLTHRVLVLFSGGPVTPPGWPTSNPFPRAQFERMLTSWVARLLGDPRKVRCTVERVDDATDAVIETVSFPFNEVALTPVDVVYSMDATPATAASTASLTYVEDLVLYQARVRAGGFGSDAKLRLQHARPSNLAAGELTLFDLLEQARAIRRMLENARGLVPEDVNPPERASQSTVNLVDLEARVVASENALLPAHKALVALVQPGAVVTSDALRTQLLKLGLFGLTPAVPCVATGDDAATRTALIRQATALLKASDQRVKQFLALRAVPVASDPRARCDQLIERVRSVYGSSYVILPTFTCDAAGGAELTSALAASTQQQGGDALAVNTWFARSSRVRDNVARLGACMRTAEVLATGDRLSLKVAQLPFSSTERWVGLPPLAGQELPAGKLSLVVQSSSTINTAMPLSGLLLDEWTEVVPNSRESTAVAFQFDPPDSCAPQTILVAVPPVPGQAWTVESLRRVLMETLDLAKLRAVDTSRLGAAAQYLPALHLAFNTADDAVSTDFASLTR